MPSWCSCCPRRWCDRCRRQWRGRCRRRGCGRCLRVSVLRINLSEDARCPSMWTSRRRRVFPCWWRPSAMLCRRKRSFRWCSCTNNEDVLICFPDARLISALLGSTFGGLLCDLGHDGGKDRMRRRWCWIGLSSWRFFLSISTFMCMFTEHTSMHACVLLLNWVPACSGTR